jgi:hypothetical protein
MSETLIDIAFCKHRVGTPFFETFDLIYGAEEEMRKSYAIEIQRCSDDY